MIELIDREATVKQICKMGEMLGVGHDRDVTIAVALFVQDDKSAFPTIEAYTFEQVQDLVALNKKLSEKIPHGEWIVSMSNTRCSNCGYNGKTVETTNFCPNCGADMKEGDTNDKL